MSDDAPSDVFLAYMSPIQLAAPAETLAARWAALKAFRSTATAEDVASLTAIAFGKTGPDAIGARLIEALKNDPQFTPIGRDNELRLLAVAALDHLFTHSPKLDALATLSIVAASFGGRKPIPLTVDLVGRAANELDQITGQKRDREKLRALVENLASSPANFTKAIAAFKAAGDFNAAGEALEALAKEFNAANIRTISSVRTLAAEIENHIDAVDEEANVFWFAFGGISEDLSESFKKLGPLRSAFVAAKEVADLTEYPLSEHVARAVLAQCGCVGKSSRVGDAVDLVSTEWISSHVDETGSPLTSPLSRALHRRGEFGSDKNWREGWASATGLAADLAADPNDLAYAFYVERMLLKLNG